jgi:hypothetical protein
MGFGSFMASTMGRLLRIAAGLVLVLAGGLWIGGIGGIILAVVGLVPLLAGIIDLCLISGLFLGTPYRGKDLRAAAK